MSTVGWGSNKFGWSVILWNRPMQRPPLSLAISLNGNTTVHRCFLSLVAEKDWVSKRWRQKTGLIPSTLQKNKQLVWTQISGTRTLCVNVRRCFSDDRNYQMSKLQKFYFIDFGYRSLLSPYLLQSVRRDLQNKIKVENSKERFFVWNVKR